MWLGCTLSVTVKGVQNVESARGCVHLLPRSFLHPRSDPFNETRSSSPDPMGLFLKWNAHVSQNPTVCTHKPCRIVVIVARIQMCWWCLCDASNTEWAPSAAGNQQYANEYIRRAHACSKSLPKTDKQACRDGASNMLKHFFFFHHELTFLTLILLCLHYWECKKPIYVRF